MCREGVDPVAVKVAVRQAQERLSCERTHISQWSAFTTNHKMEKVAARLKRCEELLMEVERLLEENVGELAHMTVGPDPGVSITKI